MVFDKYERRMGLDAKKLIKDMLKELITLSRLRRLVIVSVSPQVLRDSIKLMLKYHIYVADALQIASARKANSNVVVTRTEGWLT